MHRSGVRRHFRMGYWNSSPQEETEYDGLLPMLSLEINLVAGMSTGSIASVAPHPIKGAAVAWVWRRSRLIACDGRVQTTVPRRRKRLAGLRFGTDITARRQ
jgi:hypothetical protein